MGPFEEHMNAALNLKSFTFNQKKISKPNRFYTFNQNKEQPNWEGKDQSGDTG